MIEGLGHLSALISDEAAGVAAVVDPRRDVDMSVRWVFVHMIEEYARHNGHADLIRERIDGRTGD